MTAGPVWIDARAAARPELGGVERWTRELAARLPVLRPGGYVVRSPPAALAHRAGHLWEQLVLPVAARRARLLLCPANLAPLAHPRTAVVIHDVAPLRDPSWYSPAYVRWQRAVLPRIARRAALVITVSGFARDEIRELLGIDAHVIAGGVDHARFVPTASAPGMPEPGRYVLTVASRTARKNLGALGETAQRLGDRGLELLVAGGGRPQLAAEALPPAVRTLGHVDDAVLPALYAGAAAFVLPSRYEGFGLPCLEAMACGTPVVAAAAGALPETCGDAALLCDPDDPSAIADAVEQALDDPEPLHTRGLAHAARFSWQRTACEVDALLHRVQ